MAPPDIALATVSGTVHRNHAPGAAPQPHQGARVEFTPVVSRTRPPKPSRWPTRPGGRPSDRGALSYTLPMTLEVDGQLVSPALEEDARRDVRLATRSAVYAVDPTGVAVEADIRSALDRAAAAQARALLLRDEQDAASKAAAAATPLGRPLASASIGGASYTVEQGASLVPEAYRLPGGGGGRLCPAAHDILLDAGLLYGTVGHRG